jgi:hypothetical protein
MILEIALIIAVLPLAIFSWTGAVTMFAGIMNGSHSTEDTVGPFWVAFCLAMGATMIVGFLGQQIYTAGV